ncbi:MAG TPA: ABC transporter permease [Hyphomicrobiales bacterium]|nr:ABC transporter permease [Rhodobiaceae bacterium]HXK53878.1 ABC transporter permease [Hyphomicrobiales bacterium]
MNKSTSESRAIVPPRREFSLLGFVAAPYTIAMRNHDLIRRLVQRDIESRFRGTVLGKVWAVIAPLFMLAIYTFVFGVILNSRWQDRTDEPFLFPVIYFSGLIVFNFFFDSVARAPTLMRENQAFIKKIFFPVEIFAFAIVGSAIFRFGIGLAILAVFYLPIVGLPPLAVITYPVLFFGLALFTLGFAWILSAVSVFIRDIAHLIGLVTMLFMFLSPVFYPLSAVPEGLRAVLMFNPLTFPLESMRNALFFGDWPGLAGMAVYLAAGWLWAAAGHGIFMRLRPGFADVV